MECEIEGAENPWYTDTWLLRFCRARKFDYDKIKLMIEEYMKWKNENDLDGIITVSWHILNVMQKFAISIVYL